VGLFVSLKSKERIPSIFLKNLSIKNFKCIKEASIDLNEGVNILIGENNSGKTAILDALRICLSYGRQWRDIYIGVNDLRLFNNSLLAQTQFLP
jgi:putative ATP-dependent endonuclease of OLD family